MTGKRKKETKMRRQEKRRKWRVMIVENRKEAPRESALWVKRAYPTQKRRKKKKKK
jgi:hypothetical protein